MPLADAHFHLLPCAAGQAATFVVNAALVAGQLQHRSSGL